VVYACLEKECQKLRSYYIGMLGNDIARYSFSMHLCFCSANKRSHLATLLGLNIPGMILQLEKDPSIRPDLQGKYS
jgi:hypothetical protein